MIRTDNAMTLEELRVGQAAVVTEVGGEGALRQHFLDMGVLPGTVMELVKRAPLGDPLEFRLWGYELTLRKEDAAKIQITRPVDDSAKLGDDFLGDAADPGEATNPGEATDLGDTADKRIGRAPEHPGLGEGGRYHSKADENPLPDDATMTFALAGNQNSGKTTLFNALTGANQRVGNFPGVTVEQKIGYIHGDKKLELKDLPGIYSLSPYSHEEVVSRRFILEEKPTCIINIVDATSIERNLYLTMQLMELEIPMVLALNMMDEVKENGGTIRVNEMEAALGVPVVPISAAKGEGIEELLNHARHIAHYQERPGRVDFCDKNRNGGAVHRCLHGIMHLVEDHAAAAGIPLRFAASKLAEGDPLVRETLALSQNEEEMVEHIVLQMEEERGLDRAACIADMRYSFIDKLCDKTVVEAPSLQRERSGRIDRILTGRFTAIPAFIGIMGLIFWLTFNVIGAYLQGALETGIDSLVAALSRALEGAGVSEAIQSFLVQGVCAGVGSVLSFVPVICVLFFFLSLLEDTGYLARVAFVMDKLLRKIGLSGRSIVPMLIGFGCTVPAVMATRTLPSERDRKMTVLLTPFMSCSAKVPIYAFFVASFFPGKGAPVMIGLYLLGIFVSILVALVTKRTAFKGEAIPFVMELPNYRMPKARNVGRLLWDKAGDFLKRAFTVIFIATIVIWFLQSFDFRMHMVDSPEDSMLATVAGVLAPIFAPLGFGDWRCSTALITGFMAKESVVSAITVLFGSGNALASALSWQAALSMLVFCLLYTPCVAAIAAIRRELGGRWAFGVVLEQCAVAWVVAFVCYRLVLLF